MTDVKTLGRTAWRLYETDGVPSSGVRKPYKPDIFDFVDAVEAQKASVLATLADAKALTVRPEAILIKGKTAIGDGWGGIFVWHAASSTTADDALVFSCTAGTAGRYKRLYLGPVHSKWFAVGNYPTVDTDDTTGLNAFFAVASAGVPAHIDAGTYKFTADLAAITGHAVKVTGDGRKSILKYINAAATSPTALMTFGDGATGYTKLDLSGFTVESGTILAAGKAVRVRAYQHCSIDIWIGDEFSEGWKLFDGLSLEGIYGGSGAAVTYLNWTHIYARNKGIQWHDGPELHLQQAFLKNAAAPPGVGYAVHMGGGCGGLYLENLIQLFADIAILVDTQLNQQAFTGNTTNGSGTITNIASTSGMAVGDVIRGTGIPADATLGSKTSTTITLAGGVLATATGTAVALTYRSGNTHVFLGNGAMDTNVSAGVYFNDASVNTVSKTVTAGGDFWCASCTVGSGIAVVKWTGGDISLDGSIINHAGNGITADDETVTYTLAETLKLKDNTGYGVGANGAVTVWSNARPRSNIAGSYQSGVVVRRAGADVQSGQLASDVALNNTANFFTHANLTLSIDAARGYVVTSTVTVKDTAGAANFYARITDGTTVYAATALFVSGTGVNAPISLTAYVPPGHAGSVKVEVRDISSTSGVILADEVSADDASTIVAVSI